MKMYQKNQLTDNQYLVTFPENNSGGYSWELESSQGMKIIQETHFPNVEDDSPGLKIFKVEKLDGEFQERFIVFGLKSPWNETVISVIQVPF